MVMDINWTSCGDNIHKDQIIVIYLNDTLCQLRINKKRKKRHHNLVGKKEIEDETWTIIIQSISFSLLPLVPNYVFACNLPSHSPTSTSLFS